MASTVKHDIQNVNIKDQASAAICEEGHEQSVSELQSPEVCVICLDRISEKAVALPCKHDQFDFACLGTWMQQSQVCPLCKAEVRAIGYHEKHQHRGRSTIFHLPTREIPKFRPLHDIYRRRSRAQNYHPYRHGSRSGHAHHGPGEQQTSSKADQALNFRREVYKKAMYSAYVGVNRISRYRNITPQSFTTNTNLVSRAKVFIRRELQVFDFLNPSSASFGHHSDRRASNAEFLLEYIVGILKSIDLKGSTGQAEELLKEFLGLENTKLFLHELEAWLRSPYERLADWDRHVQYGDITGVAESSRAYSLGAH